MEAEQKSKGGRPAGSREKKPRKGSKSGIICEYFDSEYCASTRDIIDRAKRLKDIVLSSSFVAQALNRWRPDWKAKYHKGLENGG